MHMCVCLVTQSCLTHCDTIDCSPPGSSVHGVFQARILEWVAIADKVLLAVLSTSKLSFSLFNDVMCSLLWKTVLLQFPVCGYLFRSVLSRCFSDHCKGVEAGSPLPGFHSLYYVCLPITGYLGGETPPGSFAVWCWIPEFLCSNLQRNFVCGCMSNSWF